MVVYKILTPQEWAAFQREGVFTGSPLDLADGYVHCSSGAQVAATAARFFGDAGPLVVVELATGTLGEALRWEAAANGEHFPHLYAELPAAAVTRVHHVAGAADVAAAVSER